MTGHVEVSNSTTKMQTISLYVAAASMRAGVFSFADGHSTNELSRWTALSNTSLRLAAGTATVIGVTVNAPRRISLGERYAVVWAAIEAPGKTSIRLVNRVGMRMYVTAGRSAPARYTVSKPKARRSPSGVPLVTATIRNGGKSTLTVTGSITLTHGPGGVRAGPFRFTLTPPLAPGRTRALAVPLTRQLPRGPWRARVASTSGSARRFSTATITFPARGATRP